MQKNVRFFFFNYFHLFVPLTPLTRTWYLLAQDDNCGNIKSYELYIKINDDNLIHENENYEEN